LSIEYNNYHYNNGDLSIFSSAKILWKWDDVNQKWQAYSVEPSLQTIINQNDDIENITNINANEGF